MRSIINAAVTHIHSINCQYQGNNSSGPYRPSDCQGKDRRLNMYCCTRFAKAPIRLVAYCEQSLVFVNSGGSNPEVTNHNSKVFVSALMRTKNKEDWWGRGEGHEAYCTVRSGRGYSMCTTRCAPWIYAGRYCDGQVHTSRSRQDATV